ncbi:MAG: hypothetical protein RSC02_02400 [Malacoplasma sp.]
MSNVRIKVKNVENDSKIYLECTKMIAKENESISTNIMNTTLATLTITIITNFLALPAVLAILPIIVAILVWIGFF